MKKSTLLKIAKLVKRFWIVPAVSICLIAALSFSDVFEPYIIKIIIDDLLVNGLSHNGQYSVTALAVIYMTVMIFSYGLRYLSNTFLGTFSQKIQLTIREKLFSKILYFTPPKLQELKTGDLITRITHDTEAVGSQFAEMIPYLLQNFFLSLMTITAMLVMDWKLAIPTVFLMFVYVFLIIFIRKKVAVIYTRFKKSISGTGSFALESIKGMQLIKGFNKEKKVANSFNIWSENSYRAEMQGLKLWGFIVPIIEFINSLAIVLLVYISMGRVALGAVEVGVIIAFTQYIKRLTGQLAGVGGIMAQMQSAKISSQRILEILNDDTSNEQLDEGEELLEINKIAFKNVWFKYPGNTEWVLKEVSLDINKGETVAIVGVTGAGKSTLLNLLIRFYDVDKGRILINGKNINEYSLCSLRRAISVVSQNIFLYSDSIDNNISLSSDYDKDNMLHAKKISHVDKMLSNKGITSSYKLSENGKSLSSGQRQLISIARAVYCRPKFLMFDEATANIDSITERFIQESINDLSSECTMLIIAHRLSTINDANRIFILRDGNIVEK